jgi:hypothetical protein
LQQGWKHIGKVETISIFIFSTERHLRRIESGSRYHVAVVRFQTKVREKILRTSMLLRKYQIPSYQALDAMLNVEFLATRLPNQK